MKFKCKYLIGKKEVDFFLCEKSGKKIYIQVSFLHCMETIEWEFSPLEKIADNYPICVIKGWVWYVLGIISWIFKDTEI